MPWTGFEVTAAVLMVSLALPVAAPEVLTNVNKIGIIFSGGNVSLDKLYW